MLNVCAVAHMTASPIAKPTSPTRVVRNALIAAALGPACSCQKPMSRNEHSPMTSHDMYSSR